jgi:hypothetical protein
MNSINAPGTTASSSQATEKGVGIGSSMRGAGISATAINYSLNIANTLSARNEIIARPR